MADTTVAVASPTTTMELNSKLSVLEILELDLDMDLKRHLGANDADAETTPSSETTTLSERQSSITSPRSSICSNSTSNTSATSATSAHSSVVKPTKRVRFEESVSCSYFEENLDHLARPPLQRRSSFMQRSWDRIKSRNSSSDSDIASLATSRNRHPNNPYTISRCSSSSDMSSSLNSTAAEGKSANKAKNATRPSLVASKSLSPSSSSSSFYTIQQPLRDSAGRKYDGAQTIAFYRTKPSTTKGDWDDLLGPAKATAKTTAA